LSEITEILETNFALIVMREISADYKEERKLVT
jgi:hypothetical protein